MNVTKWFKTLALALEKLRLKLDPVQTQRVQEALEQIHHNQHQLFHDLINKNSNCELIISNVMRKNKNSIKHV